jgi:methylmalonyl-CoA mutase
MQEMLAHAEPLALLRARVGAARAVRERAIATRRESITGVTDFPLLDAAAPEFMERRRPAGGRGGNSIAREDAAYLAPIRWAEPFEALRDRAEAIEPRPSVFFATLGALAQFGPRAQFARNLFAAGGVGALGEEEEYASRDAMIDAFRAAHAHVAVIVGTDSAYKAETENAAQRLKAGGARWVILAGRPGESEARLRAAGVDQFVFAGQDALAELETLHAALGIGT